MCKNIPVKAQYAPPHPAIWGPQAQIASDMGTPQPTNRKRSGAPLSGIGSPLSHRLVHR